MTSQIGHINPPVVSQALTTVDSAEAQRSGALRDLLKKTVNARQNKPVVKAANTSNQGPVPQPNRANASPEGQVSSAELAQSVGLRGRELDDKKLSGRFRELFLAITTGDSRFLELCIHSLLKSVEDQTRSIVDDLNTASPEEKAAVKLLLLQIAILDSESYAINGETLTDLIRMRDQLLATNNQTLDEFLLTVSVGMMAAKPLKIGVKQLAMVNRMLAKGESLDPVEIYNFLFKLISSNSRNLITKLEVLRRHWLLLADREKTQYPLELTAQRQHFIQSRINQINLIIRDIGNLDQIAKVCEKAGVSKVPESGRVLLELIGIVASQGVGSANRLTRMFDAMAPAMRGTQIYCINLQHVMYNGLIFSNRQNEKTFHQVTQVITNTLKSSYMHKSVEVEDS